MLGWIFTMNSESVTASEGASEWANDMAMAISPIQYNAVSSDPQWLVAEDLTKPGDIQ